MFAMIGRLLRDPLAAAQFVRYSVIGATVFCIDVGLFQLFVWLRMLLPVAVTSSYILATAVNFTLNKYWNFRSSERSVKSQLRTYFIINAIILLTTIAIVEAGVHVAGLAPILAKIIAILANIPLGFVAHKYLTFGPGIGASLQQIRSRRDAGGLSR